MTEAIIITAIWFFWLILDFIQRATGRFDGLEWVAIFAAIACTVVAQFIF